MRSIRFDGWLKTTSAGKRIALALVFALFLLGILGGLVIFFIHDKTGQSSQAANQKPHIQQLGRKDLARKPGE